MRTQLRATTGQVLEGIASAYPADIDDPSCVDLDNAAALEALLGADVEPTLAARGWAIDHPRTAWGVERRGWTRGREQGPLALGVAAGRAALERSGRAASEIDTLVAATSTPTRVSASFAARLGNALGVDGACVDVRAGGAGGLEALVTAVGRLALGAQRVLVVAVEVPSRFLDPADLANALLFGDGATALVLGASAEAGGLVAARSGLEPSRGRAFSVDGELSSQPTDPLRFKRPDATYRTALAEAWEAALGAALDLGDTLPVAVHPYAVTSAQLARIEARLEQGMDHAYANLARRGALGCVGPLAVFADWVEAHGAEGRPPAGDEHLLCAVGGGISWTVLRWRTT